MGRLVKQYYGSVYLVPLLGLSFLLTWQFLPLLLGENFGIVFHISEGITLLLIAFLARIKALVKNPRFSLQIASLLLALTPFYTLLPQELSSWTMLLSGIVAGATLAWILAMWFELYCQYSTKIAVNYTLTAFALSGIIRFALVVLPFINDTGLLVTLSLMPIAAQATFPLVRRSVDGELVIHKTFIDAPPSERKPKRFEAVGFFGQVVFLGIILGVMQNGMPHWPFEEASHSVGHALRFLIPVFLLIWANIVTRNEGYESLLRIFVALSAICLAIPLFFNAYIPFIIPSFVLVARNFVSILIYLMLFSVVRDYDVHPLKVFGTARGAFNVAISTGLFLSIYTHLAELLARLNETVFYFLMTCVLILILGSYSNVFTRTFLSNLSTTAATRSVGIDERCQSLTKRFGLSKREEEVLRLLLQGRTKRYIAETLYLSEATVRWHTKKIYSKLNIHNKQELLTIAGIE